MTKTEFTGEVEAICSRGRREALRYRPASKGETEREALTSAIKDTLLPSIAEAIDAIYELGAPTEMRQQTEVLLLALQGAVDKAEELNTPTIEKIEVLFGPSGRLARKAGLVSCIYG